MCSHAFAYLFYDSEQETTVYFEWAVVCLMKIANVKKRFQTNSTDEPRSEKKNNDEKKGEGEDEEAHNYKQTENNKAFQIIWIPEHQSASHISPIRRIQTGNALCAPLQYFDLESHIHFKKSCAYRVYIHQNDT